MEFKSKLLVDARERAKVTYQDLKGYADEAGVFSDDAISYLGWRLNHCGCGNPEEAQGYLLRVLRYVNQRKTEVANRNPSQAEWEKISERWRAIEAELFPVTGQEDLVYYMLDHLHLVEHGSSLPGWLTSKGLEILEALEETQAYLAGLQKECDDA